MMPAAAPDPVKLLLPALDRLNQTSSTHFLDLKAFRTTMSKKPHQSISKDGFRVLRVSEFQPTIVCELIDRSIHQPPEYYAVSYAWGTEPASRTIVCNGEEFAVTLHLYECIASISHLYGFQDIWIDAICIDQQNDAEKAEQVSMMGQIYKQAQKVYIWLGASENGSDAAFDFIQSHAEALLAQGIPNLITPRLNGPEARIFDNLTLPLVKSIWALCTRSWFYRLWTVQEIILARQTEFVCGLKALDGDILSLFAISMWQGKFSMYAFASFDIDLEGDFEGFAGLAGILKWKRRTSSDQNMFVAFVQWCRMKGVKLPVDRIYGLLGLCEKGDPYFQGITADYSESNTTQYWQVYSKFGKLCLLHEPDLYLLAITGSKFRPSELPSWCPNFDSMPPQPGQLPKYFAGWPAKNHCQGPSKTACLSSHPSFKQRGDGYVTISPVTDEIVTQGCILDCVAQVSDKYVFSKVPCSTDNKAPLRLFCSNRISWFSEMKHMARSAYGTSDDIPDALWRTLVGDVDRTPQGIRWPCRIERRNQFGIYEQNLKYLLDDNNTDGKGGDRDIYGEFLHQNVDAIEEFSTGLDRLWYGRSFFRTTKGRIGFASENVTAGDLICMFYSGPSVYLLREASGVESPLFNFISDGYTHGLMGGEAFDLLDREETEEQKFTII